MIPHFPECNLRDLDAHQPAGGVSEDDRTGSAALFPTPERRWLSRNLGSSPTDNFCPAPGANSQTEVKAELDLVPSSVNTGDRIQLRLVKLEGTVLSTDTQVPI